MFLHFGAENNIGTSILMRRKCKNTPKELEYHTKKPETQVSMQDIRFTDSHEWIHCDGPTLGRTGITAHAQKELGEVVYIELPKVGQKVKMGEAICVIESTKAATDIYAPVSGTVIAVNEVLVKNPHALNDDPEGAGWLFQIKCSDVKEAKRLLTREEYHTLI